MKMKYMAILLLVVTGIATAADNFTYKEVSTDYFRVSFSSMESISLQTAQQRGVPYAMQLCQSKEIQFGKYTYEKKEILSKGAPSPELQFRLKQDIHCNGGKSIQTTSKSAEKVNKIKVQNEIKKLSIRYFKLLDQSEFDAAYSMLSEKMKSHSEFSRWATDRKSFNSISGEAVDKNIWKATVYIDPPNAPERGVYVAADFENSYENIPYNCGYLIWFKGESGAYKITREERGYIPASVLNKINSSEIEGVKQKMRCQPL